jgi:hypothetical protein
LEPRLALVVVTAVLLAGAAAIRSAHRPAIDVLRDL